MTDRRPHQTGFTLLELMMAVTVLGVAWVGASWSLSGAARTSTAYAGDAGEALRHAREVHELAQGLPRTPSGSLAATTAEQVQALDSLHGASFSPPLLASLEEAADADAWQQDVSLAVYALADLSSPTGESPIAGLAPDSNRLYRLEVAVSRAGVEVDRYSWWIHP